jgi:hypothetical protein
MTPRYSLRFESGERRGETIPIAGTSFTVGRRPGNSLQIGEASVSGRHAELVLEGTSVRVRDLGSTNGTKVEGQRVTEAELAHGARVTFGHVEMIFLDEAIQGMAASVPAPQGQLADAGTTVSAELVARSRNKGSRLVLVLAPIALLAVGAAWWFGRGGSGGTGPGRVTQPVTPVAGNLLGESYSFEGESLAWTAQDGAAATWTPQASARSSGELGLGVDLDPGESAASASPPVRVSAGRGLVARARVRARGAASVTLAIELVPSDAQVLGRPSARSTTAEPSDAFQDLEVALRVPEGFASARVIVEARAASSGASGEQEVASADVDDVSLVEGENAGNEIVIGAFRFAAIGEPPTCAVLGRAGNLLASELYLESTDAPDGSSPAALAPTAEQTGARVQIPAHHRLVVRLEPRALGAGCATLSAEGYSARSADFQAESVDTVLVGRDLELFGLRCEPALPVVGRTSDGAMVLRIGSGAPASVLLQTDFQVELARAHELVRIAEEAESTGKMGPCLAALGELLARYPVQSDLVARAETTSARLTREGLEEVAKIRADFERARFFRLLDMFRSLEARNDALAEKYAGSDVIGDVQALAGEIGAEVAALRARQDSFERGRLAAILAGLKAQKAPELSKAVESYLSEHFASESP